MTTENKTTRRKQSLYKNHQVVLIGFFVSFCAIASALILDIAHFSPHYLYLWTAWVLGSETVFLSLIWFAQTITSRFARNLNFAIFTNWLLLWLWSLSFLHEIRLIALFGAMLALIFLLSYGGLRFSILLSGITTIGFLISAWIDPRITNEHLHQELYYGSFYFVMALFLSWAAAQFKKQRNQIHQALTDAKQALQVKQDFLSTMSHEIRTPLNMVIGSTYLLQSTPLNPEQSELVEDTNHSAGVLLSLINDILDYAKLESGKMEVEQLPFDLSANLAQMVNHHGKQFSSKGLDFSFTSELDTEYWVTGDWSKLQQILTNLLSNALKFTPSGSVQFQVSEEMPGNLKFEIQDTGIGMTRVALTKIFDSYTQADASITRAHGGTGLGLSISQQLTGLLGGDLTVTSTKDEGSTFYFSVPLERIGTQLPEPEERPTQNFEGIRFLIAEDNLMNQKLISKLITKEKGLFEIVDNGKDAVQKVQENTFDVLLMDLQMPVMDGLEATRLIRAQTALSADDAPVILALTANVLNQEQAACLEAGMDDYLTKPININLLKATVHKQLKRRRRVMTEPTTKPS